MPDVAALGVAPVLADYSSISDDPDGGEGTPIAYPIDIVQCTAVQFLGKVALISGIAISARTLERFVEQCRPLLDSRCAALAVVAEQVGQPQASCHVEDPLDQRPHPRLVFVDAEQLDGGPVHLTPDPGSRG